MSKYDYDASRSLYGQNFPFYSLIMTAMRQADSNNQRKLKEAWPGVWNELQERYSSPGGVLYGEDEHGEVR